MTSRVHKAVIPAAGRGTRMRPFSSCVPKELAPLGSRPTLDWVLSETAEGGLSEVAIVTRPDKGDLLERYVGAQQEEGRWPELDIGFVEQCEPNGLAEAIALCRDFAAEEAFALLLPDNLPLAPGYTCARMLEVFDSGDQHVLGVLDLDETSSGLYGNCGLLEWHPLGPDTIQIDRILDKRPGLLEIGPGERVLRNCGRYVCAPEIFDLIDQLRPTVSGEYDEVPVYQHLAVRQRVRGVLIPPPLFDVGHGRGLLEASAYLSESEGAE